MHDMFFQLYGFASLLAALAVGTGGSEDLGTSEGARPGEHLQRAPEIHQNKLGFCWEKHGKIMGKSSINDYK